MLTARESDVLHELERGSSNREIGRRLFISESTVKVHLRHIYEKLGVRTRAELLAKRSRRL
jgi:DNA-binding NarL/FixJ family response regulator